MRVGMGLIYDTSSGLDTSALTLGTPTLTPAQLADAINNLPDPAYHRYDSMLNTPPGFAPCVPTNFVGPLAPDQVYCGSPGTFGGPGTIDESGAVTPGSAIAKYAPWVLGGIAAVLVIRALGGRR